MCIKPEVFGMLGQAREEGMLSRVCEMEEQTEKYTFFFKEPIPCSTLYNRFRACLITLIILLRKTIPILILNARGQGSTSSTLTHCI